MVNLPGSPGFAAHGLPPREPSGIFGASLREPPANLEAEQALLGALLANNRALDRVADFLLPEHFALPAHGVIFGAIRQRVEAGQMVDVVTLRPELEGNGALLEVGGAGYLAELLGAMVGIINAASYGRLIRDSWHRRELIEAGTQLVNGAFEPPEDMPTPGALQEAHEALLMQLAEGAAPNLARAGARVADDMVEAMLAAIDRKGGLAGMSTGYAGLDRMLGGLERKQLVVLAGRPGMGKTALGAGIAARAAAAGARTYFWGGEMDSHSVMARIAAAEAQVPLMAIRRGAVAEGGTLRPLLRDSAEVQAVANAARRIAALPIHWDAQPGLGVQALRSRLRRHKRKHGLDLVVVDHLGLLHGSKNAARGGKTAEVAEISDHLKAMAMELDVPVLALCQLNRGLEGRDSKRPSLADLRQSGEIEEDADVVMFIHREHYYLEKAKPVKKPGQDEEKFSATLAEWAAQVRDTEFVGEVIVGKQRQGETGTVPLRWMPRFTWYADPDEREDAGALPRSAA